MRSSIPFISKFDSLSHESDRLLARAMTSEPQPLPSSYKIACFGKLACRNSATTSAVSDALDDTGGTPMMT
jgi:hypothetical protein